MSASLALKYAEQFLSLLVQRNFQDTLKRQFYIGFLNRCMDAVFAVLNDIVSSFNAVDNVIFEEVHLSVAVLATDSVIKPFSL